MTILYKATAEGQIPFTEEEMAIWESDQAILIAENAELAKTAYQRQRADEYPSMADYLDGLVKGDQVQMQTYIDACLAVKAKYPKE